MDRWLAEITEAERNSLYLWLGILTGVVLLGFGAILLMRRYLWSGKESPTEDAGFSLSELRAMRDRGEITPEEYEQTRALVIAKVKGAAASSAKPNDPRQMEPGEPSA
jgi:hypothetical protein